jgi:hypothetical protein
MTSPWRQRCTAAQTRGRTIERQADGLRIALVRLASGEGEQGEVDKSVRAIRDQLVLVEQLAAVLAAGGVP